MKQQSRGAAGIAPVLLAVIFCANSLPAERPGGFTVIGPGGGGAMFLPTISPVDPQTVFVSCDMTGSYLTHDGGASWRMFNLRGRARFFVFDPKDRNVMYIQTIGLWRSKDGGQTWKLIHPNPANIRGVRMPDDHAGESIVSDASPAGQALAMAVDPNDSKKLIVAFGDRRRASLYISKDQGNTWTIEQTFDGPVKQVYAHGGEMVVVRGDGVSVRGVGGWRHGKALGVLVDASAGFAQKGGSVLYAATERAVFVSRDGGSSWEAATIPGSGAKLRAIATSLHHPETAYLSYSNLHDSDGTWFGVLKTTDSGRTWKAVWREQRTAAENVHDIWITERFGPGWAEAPIGLGVSPNDPNLCYGTDMGRTVKTTDGGANWRAVYSKKVPDAGFTSTGLDVTNAYGLHFDPFDPKRWFMTMTDVGLFRSDDAGATWVSSTAGVPRRILNTAYWVEFDPEVSGRMWAAMSATHDLPRQKMWRNTPPVTYQGGMFRSDDGGLTWKASSDGMPSGAPTHVLLDPTSPRDRRILYAAVFGHGVYKSTDDGRNWLLKNAGITGEEPFAWRLARTRSGVLYAIVARRSDQVPGALYRSTDAGEHWTRVRLPEGVTGPNGIAFDERDERRVYLAAWPREVGMHGEGGGVWMSQDEGQTWRNIFSRDQHIYDVTTDPRDPNLLYACGFESAAWRSNDRGATWARIPGFNFKWGYRVIPDPFDRAKVFITTFGGGVWYGRLDGNPQAVLDVATEGLR